jgi:hypothetical protein
VDGLIRLDTPTRPQIRLFLVEKQSARRNQYFVGRLRGSVAMGVELPGQARLCDIDAEGPFLILAS